MPAPETSAAQHFSDPDAVANYASGPRKLVPGHDALLAMTDILLAEKLGDRASVFVLGAGGGLEMAHFAQNHPGWHFVGVDPSAAMLDLAAKTMGDMAARAELVCGYVDSAPKGPYDAATCLLTLHFIPAAERLTTLQAILARLKPGAPFVAAHHAVPGDAQERAAWFARFAAFAEHSGVPQAQARTAAARLPLELPILSPSEDEALLVQAGFVRVQQFYAAFTFRGWVAEAP